MSALGYIGAAWLGASIVVGVGLALCCRIGADAERRRDRP